MAHCALLLPQANTMLTALRALPRTVWLIGLISLLNDAAGAMTYPLIPL